MGGNSKSGGGATEDLTWGYRTPQGQLYTEIRLMNKRGSKYDGIKNAYERGSIGRIVKAQLILLSYRPGDLRDPWTFPHCFRATSSRYSVPAGSSRWARY